MIWDTCTQRKPDKIGFEVIDVTTYDYFTPVVKVTSHFSPYTSTANYLSVGLHISKTTQPNFTNFLMHAYGRGCKPCRHHVLPFYG